MGALAQLCLNVNQLLRLRPLVTSERRHEYITMYYVYRKFPWSK